MLSTTTPIILFRGHVGPIVTFARKPSTSQVWPVDFVWGLRKHRDYPRRLTIPIKVNAVRSMIGSILDLPISKDILDVDGSTTLVTRLLQWVNLVRQCTLGGHHTRIGLWTSAWAKLSFSLKILSPHMAQGSQPTRKWCRTLRVTVILALISFLDFHLRYQRPRKTSTDQLIHSSILGYIRA